MNESHTHPPHPVYSADQPVDTPADDLYRRAPFAAGVAKAIGSLPMGECFVIAIHGPWGDGKTSVLNFVRSHFTGDTPVEIAEFNPWRLGDEEELFRGFFGVLAGVIGKTLSTRWERARRVLGLLARAGRWLLTPVSWLWKPAETAVEVLSKLEGAARAGDSVAIDKLKGRLTTLLEESPKRLVVFIDDIDRLDADEVTALFRLIKACADFPNLVYVLAFDREMVASTLGKRLTDGDVDAGRRFLEKIVQIPLSMPPAAATDLDRACKRGIHEVLEQSGLSLSESESLRWQWAFQDGVSRRLRTPRNVAQYLNAVRFAVPLLANEVNTVDLLLVEALRVFYPAAYEVIRTNQRVFIGVPAGEVERRIGQSPQEDLLADAKKGLDAGAGDALDTLVETLFPRYHASMKGRVLGWESIKQWTSEKLICSPAYGPRYYSYAVGSSDVADRDIDAIIAAAAASDGSQTRTLLDVQAADPFKQMVLIQKLDDRCSALSDRAASRLAVAMAMLSDRFSEPFSIHDHYHAGIDAAELTVRFCRQCQDPGARAELATQVVREASEMWFVATFMDRADPFRIDPKKGGPFLDDPGMASLRKAFSFRFETFARPGERLLDLEHRWKFEMLFSVARAAGRPAVQDRFVPHMQTDGNIAIRMLQCLAQPISRSGQIIPTPGDLEMKDLDTLELLVDVDAMAKVVIEQWIPERRQKRPEQWGVLESDDDRVLAQFWHFYPKWKARVEASAHRSPVENSQAPSASEPSR